jgi:hypothetical protein
MEALSAYSWPGNVRELRNVLYEALVYKRAGEELLLSDLPKRVLETEPRSGHPLSDLVVREAIARRIEAGTMNLRRLVEDVERVALEAALTLAGGSPARAARLREKSDGAALRSGGTVRAMRKGLTGPVPNSPLRASLIRFPTMARSRRAFLAAAGGGITALSAEAFGRIRALPSASPEAAAQDEDFSIRVRESFTIDRNSINLNSGSVSPAPRSVQTAMHQYWDITNMSPSYYVDEILGPRVEVVRRRLADAFGCDPEEMAITRNTSEGMQIVQMGLDVKRGDEVLTTTQDYPRMLTAWQQREARDGIVLKTVSFPTPPPGPEDLLERIEAAITPRTRVLLICHVTYTTGQIFPVKEICRLARERGIETVVDGAHGFAHFPFTRDDLDCDYYATSLHKWLSAPVGTGFLYVRREKIRDLWPLMAAPLSMREDIRKFEEIGTNRSRLRRHHRALTFHDGLARNGRRSVCATCAGGGPIACATSPGFGCSTRRIRERAAASVL